MPVPRNSEIELMKSQKTEHKPDTVETQTRPILTVDGLSKSFFSPDREKIVPVLEQLSLTVSEGEFVSIFGPNGCGKTTLLKVIADLEAPDTGQVYRRWKDSNASARLGVVFQNYGDTLLPWATAIDNVAFPLLPQLKSADTRNSAAKHVLKELGVNFDTRKYPYQLSGGEQQLCCLARALVHAPRVLLLDEPFSALDIEFRRRMQELIVKCWRERSLSIIMVSHDLDEAILLASRFILLGKQPGKVKLDIPVELPYPRTLEQIESVPFFELRKKILEVVRKEAGA